MAMIAAHRGCAKRGGSELGNDPLSSHASAMDFPNVFVFDHPVIQTKLTELRDYTTDHRKFRALLDEIASLMLYEVTRDWPTMPKVVQTPRERTIGQVLARPVTRVPILRAGVGRADGVLK